MSSILPALGRFAGATARGIAQQKVGQRQDDLAERARKNQELLQTLMLKRQAAQDTGEEEDRNVRMLGLLGQGAPLHAGTAPTEPTSTFAPTADPMGAIARPMTQPMGAVATTPAPRSIQRGNYYVTPGEVDAQSAAAAQKTDTAQRAAHAFATKLLGAENVGDYQPGANYVQLLPELMKERASSTEKAADRAFTGSQTDKQIAAGDRRSQAQIAATLAAARMRTGGGTGMTPGMRAKYAESDKQLSELSGLIDTYQANLKRHGTQLYSSHDNPDDNALQSSYQAVMMSLKNANDLGVLNGRDAEFLMAQLGQPTGVMAKWRGTGGIGGQIDAVKRTIDTKRKALRTAYGVESGEDLTTPPPKTPGPARPAAPASAADLWEQLVAGGMSAQAATAEVTRRMGTP